MDDVTFSNGWEGALTLAIVLMVMYVVAMWVAAVVWTFRDVRARTEDLFEQAAAVLMVVVFNVPGLLLYVLMRPKETLEDQLDRRLEAEAMFHDMQLHPTCPQCVGRVEPDFVYCPSCKTQLRTPCGDCGKALAVEWLVCPYCNYERGERPAVASRQRGYGRVTFEGGSLTTAARQRA